MCCLPFGIAEFLNNDWQKYLVEKKLNSQIIPKTTHVDEYSFENYPCGRVN